MLMKSDEEKCASVRARVCVCVWHAAMIERGMCPSLLLVCVNVLCAIYTYMYLIQYLCECMCMACDCVHNKVSGNVIGWLEFR